MGLIIWVLVVLAGLYLFGVLTCLLSTRNNKEVDKGKCFKPLSWLSYALGYVIKRFVPLHVFEQIVLRIYDEECSRCVADGKCFDCGCDMPAKAYVPYESCSRGNWGPIIWGKKEYKELRKTYPVKIKIEYANESL